MLPETVTCEAETEPEPGWGALRKRSDELTVRYASVMEAIARGDAGPDRGRQMVHLTAAHRQHCAELARIRFGAAYVSEAEDRAYERGMAAVRVPGQRKHRHAAAQRSFVPRLVQGISVPVVIGAALGRRLVAHHAIASVAGAGAATAGLVAVTVALGPSHTAEYITPWSQPPPPSPTAPSHGPLLPANRLISVQHPASVLEPYRKPVRPLVVTYTPAPVAAAPTTPPVTPATDPSQPVPQPASDPSPGPSSSWPLPSPPSQTYQPSRTYQSPASLDLRARGGHAAEWSSPGTSGYQPRHGGDGQDRQQGNGGLQAGNLQGGPQQNASWQSGGGQSGGGQSGRGRQHGGY